MANATERDARRANWQARGASWNRTAPAGLSTADAHNRRLIAAAGIANGMTVLDCATGAGEPLISVAVAVGASGRVIGTDLVLEMMAGARRRAATLALGNVAFAVGSMDALPFAGGRFDALTCRFGLMFLPDPVAAASEMRRVLRPGARVAVMVHGPAAHNTMFETVRAAVLGFFGEPDSGRTAERYRFAAEGSAASVLEAAGFAAVGEESFDETTMAKADDPFWRPSLMRSWAQRADRLDPARRRALEAAVAAAFEPYRQGREIAIRSHVRLAAAHAP